MIKTGNAWDGIERRVLFIDKLNKIEEKVEVIHEKLDNVIVEINRIKGIFGGVLLVIGALWAGISTFKDKLFK